MIKFWILSIMLAILSPEVMIRKREKKSISSLSMRINFIHPKKLEIGDWKKKYICIKLCILSSSNVEKFNAITRPHWVKLKMWIKLHLHSHMHVRLEERKKSIFTSSAANDQEKLLCKVTKNVFHIITIIIILS